MGRDIGRLQAGLPQCEAGQNLHKQPANGKETCTELGIAAAARMHGHTKDNGSSAQGCLIPAATGGFGDSQES